MTGILDLFVPREKNFFVHLNRQIILLDEATKALATLTKDKKLEPKKLQKQITKIRSLSHEVDDISHEIITQLHIIFITSIDREDIKSLAINLGIIVDSVKTLATSISYLKIEKFDKSFLQQIVILKESVDLLKYIFQEPLSPKRNGGTLEKMKQLEKEADEIYRKAVGELFTKKRNAVEIIKQKELYDSAENAIDNIRRIVDLLETIILINA